jgi:hypothetical protein
MQKRRTRMPDDKKLTVKDVKTLSAALDVIAGKPAYATITDRPPVALTGHPPEPVALTGHAPVDAPSTPNAPAGYGNPPVATQWKPGQSGNPKGRPKGETLGEIFRRVAKGPAESRKIGQPFDTEMGHIIRRLFSRVGNFSNPQEAKLLLALAREFLPEREDEGAADEIIDAESAAVEPEASAQS